MGSFFVLFLWWILFVFFEECEFWFVSLEWLVDRKQVPENWNTELDKLEKEIEYAKTLTPPELKEITEEECTNYFSKRVRKNRKEILTSKM